MSDIFELGEHGCKITILDLEEVATPTHMVRSDKDIGDGTLAIPLSEISLDGGTVLDDI